MKHAHTSINLRVKTLNQQAPTTPGALNSINLIDKENSKNSSNNSIAFPMDDEGFNLEPRGFASPVEDIANDQYLYNICKSQSENLPLHIDNFLKRAFDEGADFHYIYPKENKDVIIINDEDDFGSYESPINAKFKSPINLFDHLFLSFLESQIQYKSSIERFATIANEIKNLKINYYSKLFCKTKVNSDTNLDITLYDYEIDLSETERRLENDDLIFMNYFDVVLFFLKKEIQPNSVSIYDIFDELLQSHDLRVLSKLQQISDIPKEKIASALNKLDSYYSEAKKKQELVPYPRCFESCSTKNLTDPNIALTEIWFGGMERALKNYRYFSFMPDPKIQSPNIQTPLLARMNEVS